MSYIEKNTTKTALTEDAMESPSQQLQRFQSALQQFQMQVATIAQS